MQLVNAALGTRFTRRYNLSCDLWVLQITMTYAYWKAGRHLEYAVFDMFFRKSPFEGEFTIFAGLDEAIKLVQTFRFTPEHVDYLKSLLPMCEPEFWGEYIHLRHKTCAAVRTFHADMYDVPLRHLNYRCACCAGVHAERPARLCCS